MAVEKMEDLLDWQNYQNGEVYAIGTTPDGELVATGTMEAGNEVQILVTVGGKGADPLPLDSFVRFQVPIEYYEVPRLWDGRGR